MLSGCSVTRPASEGKTLERPPVNSYSGDETTRFVSRPVMKMPLAKAAVTCVLLASAAIAEPQDSVPRWGAKSRSGWVNAVWDGARTTGNWIATTEVLPGRSARVRIDGKSLDVRFFYEDMLGLDGYAYVSQGVAAEFGIPAREPVRLHVAVMDPGSGVVWGADDAIEYQDVEEILPGEMWNAEGGPVVEAHRGENGELVNRIRLGAVRGPMTFVYADKASEDAYLPFVYHVVFDFETEQSATRAADIMVRNGVRSSRVSATRNTHAVEAGPVDTLVEAEAILREASSHGINDGRIRRVRRRSDG